LFLILRCMYVVSDVSEKDRTGGRQAHQLPPGRHGLSRSFVAENQRERILAAVADVVSAASYAEMTVEGIIVTAGVSRRTFYEHFKNKDDAFLAAYDAITAQLVGEVLPAVDAADGFAARAAAGLGTFLDFLASEPAFARMCIVEALAAGPEAIRRRNDTMRAFADLIDRNAQELLAGKVAPGLTAETIVGGIYEVVYTRVVRGEIRELPALLPDLTYSALLPYLGPEAAAAERRRLLDSQQAA
jgi:AcrR family transcriptional regulator